LAEIVNARESAGPGEPVTCVVEIPKGSRSKYEYEIGHFCAVYKDLDDNRRSTVCGWRDYGAALLEIEESRRRYREHKRRELTRPDRNLA
jgi:inorganic pyrophosphatase